LTAPGVELLEPEQIEAFLEEIGKAMHKGSRRLLRESPEDPLAYRLARQGLYLHITDAPPTEEGNRTYVPPPARGRAEQLGALLESQDWRALLFETELSLVEDRFWLDLHRYVMLALAGLGYEPARDAVVQETGFIVRRLPGVLDLEFTDGRPFASQPTRDWLQASTAAGSDSSSSPAIALDDDFAHALQEAQRAGREGKLEEAVDSLSAIIQSDSDGGRDRFRAKLAMADACTVAGSHVLAEGILAGLSEEIQRFHLENWEPKLTEACYRARYEAIKAMGTESTKSREELVDVYRQLCRVSPSVALSLRGPGTGR
jgi:type VI secretion system protein VasJ